MPLQTVTHYENNVPDLVHVSPLLIRKQFRVLTAPIGAATSGLGGYTMQQARCILSSFLKHEAGHTPLVEITNGNQ
jgi:hypothetical protein